MLKIGIKTNYIARTNYDWMCFLVEQTFGFLEITSARRHRCIVRNSNILTKHNIGYF